MILGMFEGADVCFQWKTDKWKKLVELMPNLEWNNLNLIAVWLTDIPRRPVQLGLYNPDLEET